MSNEKIILVCVTAQRSCERIIRAGYLLSKSTNLRLKVLSLQPHEQNKNINRNALEYLFGVCKSLNTEMQIYCGDNVNDMAIDYVSQNNIGQLIVGSPKKLEPGNFVFEIHLAFPGIPLTSVDESNTLKTFSI